VIPPGVLVAPSRPLVIAPGEPAPDQPTWDQPAPDEPTSPAPPTATAPPKVVAQNVPWYRRLLASPRRLVAAGVIIVLLVAALLWWNAARASAVTYLTAPVTRGSVAKAVTASGTVNPVLNILVGTYVSGVISALYCDFNTKVTKGQICAKIDPRPYQVVVDQENANVGTAVAQLAKDSAALVYAKLSYDRCVALLKEGYITADSADRAKNTLDQAIAQIQVDQTGVTQHRAVLSAAQVNLGYTDIVSPVNGTVVSRNVTMGQTVAASFTTPTLFVIGEDLTKMEVDANVSESDIGAIKVGDTATFTVEAYPQAFAGVVAQVRQAPQSVQNVITYDVVINVANPAFLLMPGMTATCRIVTARRDSVMRVPDLALRYAPSAVAAKPTAGVPAAATSAGGVAGGASTRGQVWLLRQGKPVEVPVSVGLDDDTYSEVLQGALQVGDTVITSERRAAGATAAPQPRL
jgi:HlyD family secretion protein